ncbi:hypothetical protein BHAOGJBA_1390 [Methylobacterium hispanicum]|uniref:Uncharacterized protein n=1 Tax=Methylobacterium hispanicum TaxID=270350 RepID=A0AAV4ZIZ2_9HYPH|nr:hypothetical protein BHAOGJBA_1390 [Methylobacterium hispanicum]
MRAEAASGLTAVARDRAGRSASSATFAIDVRDPVVVSGSPAGTAEVGRAYAAGFAAQGGRGPFVWSLAAGSLPAGLRFDTATGAISGTPTTVQTASGLQLRALDQDGRTATTDAFAIRVGTAFALSLAPVLPGSLGTAFSGQATASGGQGPYLYAISAGTLPAGLSFDGTTGRFAGTPSALSRTTLTVRGSDADGRTAQASTTISITDPLVLVLRASTAAATVGQAFSQSYAAAGGQAPYSYSLASGTLPPGLSLAAGTGTISGTPTTVGTYASLALRVVDADGRSQTTEPFAIDVRPALVLAGGTGSGAPIPYGTVGVAYASGVSASGGRGPYTYQLSAGTLPAGLVLDGASGAITGTPTKLETATGLRITATDADGRSAPGPIFQIDVRDPFVLSYAPQTASTGSAYTTVPKTTGGRAGFVYTLAGGTLPAGLRLDGASGAITGTPASSGTASGLSVRVVDADGRSATSTSFAITVMQPLTLTLAARHDVPTGSPFSVDPKADGGRQPYAWSMTPGVAGTSFDAATGRLTGILTASGTTRVTIVVTDADGRTLSGATDIVAAGAMTVRVPDTLMIRNTAYSGVFTADGGVAPYTVVRTRGALPPGIQLSGNGTLNGTPTVSGEYPITYNVIDKNGRTMSGEVTLIVAEPGLFAVNPGFVQHAWIGRYYEARGLRIFNGTGPFTLLNSPQFPTGLTMTTAGDRLVISGIPTGPEGWFPKTQPTFFFKDGTGKYWAIKGYPIEILPELKDKWYDSNEGKAAAPNGYATLDVDRFSEPPTAMAKNGKTFARKATTAGGANQVKIEVDDGKFRFNTTTQRNYGFDNYGVTTVQTLSAPAGAVDFGQRISLSRDGQWLAVSAPNVNSTYQQNKPGGYVYVYRRTGEEFTLHSTSEVNDLPGLDMLVISDDGQLLVHDVRVSLNGTISRVAAIRRWTGSSWTTESTVAEATAGIPHLSADGSTLAFGGGNVRVYKKTGASWSRIFSSPVSKIANGSDFSGPIAMNKTGSLIYHGGVVRFTGSDFIRTMYAYEWRDGGYILSNISTNSFWVGSSRPDYTMWMSGNDDLSQVAMTFGASSDFDVMYWDRPNDLASFSTRIQPGYGIGSGGKDVFMNDDGTLVLLRQSGLIAKRYFQ